MPTYRVYQRNPEGLCHVPNDLVFDDDASVLEFVTGVARAGERCEVWSGTRLVGTFRPTSAVKRQRPANLEALSLRGRTHQISGLSRWPV